MRMPQAAAFLVANFGECDAVVLLHDAIVMVEQVFRDFRDGKRAFGVQFREFFFRRSFFGLNLGALAAHGRFHFFYQQLGTLDFAVVFFACDHLFEQAVFRLGDIFFRHLYFMLERLVGFVRFDLRSLVAVFADSFLELLNVQFVFFAVFDYGELFGFAFGEVGLRGGDTSIRIREFFRVCGKVRANVMQPYVDRLQSQKILNRCQHCPGILTHR